MHDNYLGRRSQANELQLNESRQTRSKAGTHGLGSGPARKGRIPCKGRSALTIQFTTLPCWLINRGYETQTRGVTSIRTGEPPADDCASKLNAQLQNLTDIASRVGRRGAFDRRSVLYSSGTLFAALWRHRRLGRCIALLRYSTRREGLCLLTH